MPFSADFGVARGQRRGAQTRPSQPQPRPAGAHHLIDDQALAEKLETYVRGARILALQIQERESILRALDDPPTKALVELRAVLLQERVARVRGEMA